MSSINGLKRIATTSIDNSGVIRLGTTLNPGTSGQVIKSNGADNAASWENETPNESLTIGNNLNLTSGNPDYNGGVSETINLNNNISITDLTATGNNIILSGLPTSDPGIDNKLYRDNTGRLFVSVNNK